MLSNRVTILDYGMGNLLSIYRAFEYCGAKVKISNEHNSIINSDRVILPGVGSFAKGMQHLRASNLDKVIYEIYQKEKPILGICLGMQLLFEHSEEFGFNKGLSLIDGHIVEIPNKNTELKVPHIGWSNIDFDFNKIKYTPFKTLKKMDNFYFNHSFCARVTDKKNVIGTYLYGLNELTAIVQKNQIYGCQFHPEKSGKSGLKILKEFLKL